MLEAQGESPAAHEALEKLCRTYWRPILAFCDDKGFGQTKQRTSPRGFLRAIGAQKFNAVRKEKGRLRSFLLGALKYFLADDSVARWRLSGEKDNGLFLWKNCMLTNRSRWNQQIQ